MSFKVEIEIEGYDGQLCNECENHLINTDGGAREPYHLCDQCHEDLLCTVGQFLDSKVIR